MSSRKSMPVWSFFVLALTAQGCAGFPQTGPDYSPPDESIPDHWTGPAQRVSDAAPNAQWRRVFKDPVLDGLIADGFAHNYDLAGLRANLRKARALRDKAAGRLQPTVAAEADYSAALESRAALSEIDLELSNARRSLRVNAISLMKSVGGAPVRPDSSLIRNGV